MPPLRFQECGRGPHFERPAPRPRHSLPRHEPWDCHTAEKRPGVADWGSVWAAVPWSVWARNIQAVYPNPIVAYRSQASSAMATRTLLVQQPPKHRRTERQSGFHSRDCVNDGNGPSCWFLLAFVMLWFPLSQIIVWLPLSWRSFPLFCVLDKHGN